MGRFAFVRLFGVVLGGVVAAEAGCNIAGQPCGLLNVSACDNSDSTGAGGNVCNGSLGGYGGGGGAGGGDDGVGGDGTGAGGNVGVGPGSGGSFGVGAGVGGSFGDTVGASVGAGVGGGSAWSSGRGGYRARAPRRHHGRRRGGLGKAQQAQCPFPAWQFPVIPTPAPIPPSSVPLSTTRLRFICTMNGIGTGLTGIQFSQACGLQFQRWVQWMLQEPQNTTPIDSPVRTGKTSGVVTSVIPDYWRDLKLAYQDSPMVFTIPKSFFGEVKAVNGYLPPSYSQYQILGLLDVAQLSPAGSSTLPKHPPPELVFTTTGNTKMSLLTIGQANLWGVAIWWQIVFENPAMPNDPNPDLCINACVAVNPGVYPPTVTPQPFRPNPTCTKLTDAPPTWAKLINGDPDPPEVDP